MNLRELFILDEVDNSAALPVYDCAPYKPVVRLGFDGDMVCEIMSVDRVVCGVQIDPISEEQLTQAIVLLAQNTSSNGQIKSGRYVVVSGKEEFKQYTDIHLPELNNCALLFPADNKCGALYCGSSSYSFIAFPANLIKAETPEDLMAVLLSGGANV